MTSITRQNLSAATKILILVSEQLSVTLLQSRANSWLKLLLALTIKTTFCLQIKCLSRTLLLDLEGESSCVGQKAEA